VGAAHLRYLRINWDFFRLHKAAGRRQNQLTFWPVGYQVKSHLASNALLTLCCLGSAVAFRLEGQDALRMSIAGADAARVRRQAATTLGYYNISLGPTTWRFTTALGLEYNTNVRYTGNDQSPDFIFRPELTSELLWPVTDRNALNLNVGIGYSAYVENTDLSRLYIRPGSEVSFDVYTGDFNINFHDRFSIIEETYENPTLAGQGGYSQLQNVLGVSTLGDLNQLVVRAGYDHVNFSTVSGVQYRPDGQEEVVYASGGYKLAPMLLAGAELGGALLRYEGADAGGGIQYNAGLFSQWQVSEYIHLRASGGYMLYSPEAGQYTRLTSDYSAYYLDLSIRHRINEYLNYVLNAGRSINFSYWGTSVDSYFVRWSGQWNLIQKISLNTYVDFEQGEQLDFYDERYNWMGGGISAGRRLTRKLTGSAGYSGHWRDSNVPSRSYTVHTISLQFRYSF
jgi:hypothetical protein